MRLPEPDYRDKHTGPRKAEIATLGDRKAEAMGRRCRQPFALGSQEHSRQGHREHRQDLVEEWVHFLELEMEYIPKQEYTGLL